MVMKKQRSMAMEAPNSAPTSTTTSTSSASALAVSKTSRPISKTKPTIRIIHIFAPEIIKTDAANFRELVQRLTGKPDSPAAAAPKNKHRTSSARREEPTREIAGGGVTSAPAVKEEYCGYEFWSNVGAGGDGFLGGFLDLEFGELPFYPFEGAHAMHVVDHEPQLIA